MLVEKYLPTIMGITEANMKNDAHVSALQIKGFYLERDNLGASGVSTRVAVFIAEELLYKRRSDLEIFNIPLVWLEILSNPKQPWLVAVGYRQWRSLDGEDKKESGTTKSQKDRFQLWNNSLTKAQAELKPVVLMGDINIDVTPWLHPDRQLSESPLLKMLKATASQLEFSLIKTEPTRHQGEDVPSVLDLILTNIPAQLSTPILIDSSSDHKVIFFHKSTKVKAKVLLIRKARSYKNYTKEKLQNQLNMPRLNRLLFSTNLNYVANTLVDEVNRVLDVIAPVRTIQLRTKYAAHLTEATKQMMTDRNNLKTKAILSKLDEDWSIFRKARNKTLKCQRKDKIDWASKMLLKDGNKSKMLWQTAKRLSGDNSNKTISSLTIDGITNNKSDDISNCLNKHFRSKVDLLLENMPIPSENLFEKLLNTPTPKGDEFQLYSLTQEQLSLIMKKSKKNAASGSDSITGKVLNDLYPSIQRILLHLINLSLSLGKYPDVFKETKIIPLLKF